MNECAKLRFLFVWVHQHIRSRECKIQLMRHYCMGALSLLMVWGCWDRAGKPVLELEQCNLANTNSMELLSTFGVYFFQVYLEDKKPADFLYNDGIMFLIFFSAELKEKMWCAFFIRIVKKSGKNRAKNNADFELQKYIKNSKRICKKKSDYFKWKVLMYSWFFFDFTYVVKNQDECFFTLK